MRKLLVLRLSLVAVFVLSFGGCKPRTGNQGTSDDNKSYTITKKSWLHLTKVREYAEEKEYDKALRELEKMGERTFLNDYERAKMWQAFAAIHMVQDDMESTASSLEESLKLEAMPEQEQLDTLFNLGQLYLAMEKFERSAELLSEWIEKAKNPQPSAYYIVATAHAQSKNFEGALPHALKAVEGMKEENEPWLQFLLSIYFELGSNEEVAQLLKRMVKSFPENKTYWLQLSATYASLENHDRALAVLELAYAQGMLTEQKELLTLVRLYLQREIPIKAVKLLEKHLADGAVEEDPESLELLATSWLLTQDRGQAMESLDKAAHAAETGELFLQLARLHVEKEHWKPAMKALDQAIEKGKLSSPGDAYLLLGICNFNSNRTGAALTAFDKAKEHKATVTSAQKWIDLIRKKKTDDGSSSVPPESASAPAPPP